MKKLVLVLLVLAAIGGMAFAEPSYDRGDDYGSSDKPPIYIAPAPEQEPEPELEPETSSRGSFVAWPPAVADNLVLVNLGAGFGFPYSSYYVMGLPPIKLSMDFVLPIPVPVSVGAMAGLRTWTYHRPYIDDYTVLDIPFGIRGMYHFNFAALTDSNFVSNLDVYAGLTLGWVTVFDNDKKNFGLTRPSYFLWGVNAGARYFFNDLIGLYLELGYSDFEIISLGLSLKF
jgi:hypothetical protein